MFKSLFNVGCLLVHALAMAGGMSGVLYVYHCYLLRPHEMIVVDFRALSEAKLVQMVNDARGGHAVQSTDLEEFIERVHQTILEEAQGRPVFLSGAVFNPERDLTPRVATRLGIDLTKSQSKTLPAMASQVEAAMLPPTPSAQDGQ